MNSEIKKQWIGALLSGEYKQGHSRLRRFDNTFCCLGVLCDLHSKVSGEQWDQDGDPEYAHKMPYTYMDATGSLPTAVCEWAGIETDLPWGTIPQVSVDGETVSLAKLNDEGKTFEQIVPYIEKGM